MANDFANFETLHHEAQPNYGLGRGTHYSVHRAVVWHDELGRPLASAHHHCFAMIWDEDHDTRVLPVVEQLYTEGWLAAALFIGERKDDLSVLLDAPSPFHFDPGAERRYCSLVEQLAWSAPVEKFLARVVIDSYRGRDHRIINDNENRVLDYLEGVRHRWGLGLRLLQR